MYLSKPFSVSVASVRAPAMPPCSPGFPNLGKKLSQSNSSLPTATKLWALCLCVALATHPQLHFLGSHTPRDKGG